MGFTADNADTLSVEMADLKQKTEDSRLGRPGPFDPLTGCRDHLAGRVRETARPDQGGGARDRGRGPGGGRRLGNS